MRAFGGLDARSVYGEAHAVISRFPFQTNSYIYQIVATMNAKDEDEEKKE